MSQKYTVTRQGRFKGALVRIIKRMGAMRDHMVLAEALVPHKHLPKGERIEIDMRDLSVSKSSNQAWNDPYEMKDLNKP